jgi:alkyl hydroperoxide reductase subunit F
MNLQRAAELIPATSRRPDHRQAGNGGTQSRSRHPVHRRALAQRERARRAGIQDQGRGLLPHCDGPLFKGKDVAVIGGGNSGVEAAIDLAGVVKHVTVLEFARDEGRRGADQEAEEPAQRDGAHQRPDHRDHRRRRQGQRPGFKHRGDGTDARVELEGVFVQIGLVPNTEWLGETVERSKFGEIEVDARGATNVPGVFAAGDCTTVPYKQIVMAAGAGSTPRSAPLTT